MARHLSTAETAKLLRVALKAKFPAVKFSVKSKTYSGGSSIRVEYMDGPTTALAKEVTNQFAGADFDGMIDLKTYRDAVEVNGEKVKMGADYVFVDRNLSRSFLGKVAGLVAKLYGFPVPQIGAYESNGAAYLIGCDHETDRLIYGACGDRTKLNLG